MRVASRSMEDPKAVASWEGPPKHGCQLKKMAVCVLPAGWAHTAWPVGESPLPIIATDKGPCESSKIFELPESTRFYFLSSKEAFLQDRLFQLGTICTTATDLVGKCVHNLV